MYGDGFSQAPCAGQGTGNASKKGRIFVFASTLVHIYAQFAKIKFKIYAQPAVPKKKDYFFSGFEPSLVLK